MWPWNVEEDEDEVEETEGEDDSEEEEGESDDEGEFERVEAIYRKERAEIRASTNSVDLRDRRSGYERLLRDQDASTIACVRARDLIEQIDNRITDLRAKRLAERGR